ncbi:hypothetical protein KFE25_009972 [Diacronema lutheri]|uniref:Uncharacterized protein n=2 Tax=Diacronema lutheri TaxID=2081491 RepID=A0A8J6C9I4_DIALT|nr:hypothetical protein KFE25_009972 [Diacronema lutheri]
MSLVNQITANTFAIRELEAAIGELKDRCVRRDRENAQLLAELEATSEQLLSMWQIISNPVAITDDTVAEALAADLHRRHSTDSLSLAGERAPRAGGAAAAEAGSCGASAADMHAHTPMEIALASPPQPLVPEPQSPAAASAAPADPTDGVALHVGSPVDFTGTWALAQSVGFKEYLEATGVTWAKRQIAVKLRPVQEWALADNNIWEFTMQTPIGRRIERIVVNGTVEDEIDGLHVLKESFWDRDELVTLCRPRDPAKAVAHTEFRRRYDKPADRMVLEIVTGKARCTRIFERQR